MPLVTTGSVIARQPGQGARHFFAPGLYGDRRRPGGLSLQATVLHVANPWPQS